MWPLYRALILAGEQRFELALQLRSLAALLCRREGVHGGQVVVTKAVHVGGGRHGCVEDVGMRGAGDHKESRLPVAAMG